MTLVLLAAVLLEFAGSAVFYEQAETLSAGDSRLIGVAEQLGLDLRLLDATPMSERPQLVGLLSNREFTLSLVAPAAGQAPEPPRSHPLHRLLETRLDADGRLHLVSIDRGRVVGLLRLDDGGFLRFDAPSLLVRHAVTRGLLSAAILAGCVLLVAVMLVRTLSAPLRTLAVAADAIGRGPLVPVIQSGPREVRRLAVAMNAMQTRITRLLADRTEALAAVSHDLRTPLARLRLRAGFLDDAEMLAQIEADLDEMEAMVGSVLSYLAGEHETEAVRPVDLAAMLHTLVDDAADSGQRAVYDGPDQLVLRLRPLAMKRVFANLLSNALNHAGSVRVAVLPESRMIRVRFEDDGPGIPETELERVTAPFHRLDRSRSRATGGLGLGLAIVSREIVRDGGRLQLRNRPGGGLCAEIMLFPAQRKGIAAGM